MRGLLHVDECNQLALLRIDDCHFVGLVCRSQEVTLAAIPSAVVQEPCCFDVGYRQVVNVLVVHEQDMARFLYIDDELGMLVRGHDCGDAWLRMVLLRIDGHATCRDDL